MVIPLVVVVVDPFLNGFLQLPRIVVMLQLHHIFHRAMIALDLPLGHRVIGRAPGVLDILLLEPGLELTADVTGAVVR